MSPVTALYETFRAAGRGRIMSCELPDSDNNLVLRQVQGMCREMHEMLERQARAIDLVSRLGKRMERGFDDVRCELREVKSDLVLMENRVLTA